MGQSNHSALQVAMCMWFKQQAVTAGVHVRAELRIRVSESRVRIPGVGLLDRSAEQVPIPTYRPVAGFEVISPDVRWLN